jgi:hypothetical protein
MMAQVDELQQVRARIRLEQMAANAPKEEIERTDREVKEFLDKPEVKADFAKKRVAEDKLRRASEKLARLETKNPELAAKFESQELGIEASSSSSSLSSSSSSSADPSTTELLDLFEYSRTKQEQSLATREVWESVASVTEKVEAFAKDHPTMAKYGGLLAEGAGYAMAGAALYGAAQLGTAAFFTTGASMWAQNEVMAAVIENGAEALVENAASQGRTEAEAIRFAKAAVRSIDMGLNGLVAVGAFRLIKNGAAVAGKVRTLNANFTERAKAAFQRTQASQAKFDAISARGISDAIESNPLVKMKVELLAAPKMHKHHVFPRRFVDYFSERGIRIDDHCINLGEVTHGRGVHGSGNLGMMPGKWNERWNAFVKKNPEATATEVYQFCGMLLDEFGLNHLQIVKYK